MELRRYLSVIASRWPVLIVLLIVGLIGGYMITPRATKYTAVGTIYIGSRVINAEAGDVSGDRAIGLAQFSRTAAAMVDSVSKAGSAAQTAGVDRSAEEVVRAVKALNRPLTQLLDVMVEDPDPAVAQKLANALVDQFVEDVKNLEPGSVVTEEGQLPTLPAYVFERARLPTAPNDTGLLRNLLIGGLIGVLLGLGLVLLFDYLDITVRTADDAETKLELPVLGVIPALGETLPVTPALRAIRTKTKAVR